MIVVFAYSDVPYAYVMSMSALVNATGADSSSWVTGRRP